MLREISIENFKAFSALALTMRPLTVLTGLNSSGKSSILQAILLAELARSADSVPLNGPYGLNLGEASDVLHHDASSATINIWLADTDWTDGFSFEVPTERSVALPLRSKEVARPGNQSLIGTYLSAERLGPRDLLAVDPDTHAALGDSSEHDAQDEVLSVGHQGQYTPHVLAQYDRRQVREQLRHLGPERDSQVAITLTTQAELWLSEITQPIRVQATWLTGTNAATVRFRGAGAQTEWMRPANVGFGLSYALPIVVGCLLASPNRLVMVENPEAHLHPAGQSAMGRFLSRVAASGVQTVIETHSDHVVNGIRRAVVEDELLSPDDVVLHYFAANEPVTIEVQETGSLSAWPQGFFDQSERDLTALSRVARRANP